MFILGDIERKRGALGRINLKIGSIKAFLDNQQNSGISVNYYQCFFVLAVQRLCVIVRIIQALKQCAPDPNIFIFEESEESRLYRRFLNRWDNSWVKEETEEEKKIQEKLWRLKNKKKVLNPKSKTYKEICSYAYDDLVSVVTDIRNKTLDTMDNDNKATKFRYFILSVISKRLSISE